jgi:hypothetical protein
VFGLLAFGAFACGEDAPAPGASFQVVGLAPVAPSNSSGGGAIGLGLVCNDRQPCPSGSDCLTASQAATSGFCSPACTSADMATSCAYGGPGQGACIINTISGSMTGDHCGLVCTPTTTPSCPGGMTCQMQQMVMGMTIGICLPPPPEPVRR